MWTICRCLLSVSFMLSHGWLFLWIFRDCFATSFQVVMRILSRRCMEYILPLAHWAQFYWNCNIQKYHQRQRGTTKIIKSYMLHRDLWVYFTTRSSNRNSINNNNNISRNSIISTSNSTSSHLSVEQTSRTIQNRVWDLNRMWAHQKKT